MSEKQSNVKPKKASILGASALSFIQKVASGDLSAKIEQDLPKSDVEMTDAANSTIPRSNTETSLDKATSTLAESLNTKCST